MAKPRELRRRIKSVQSTRKITKTMELVATSKLKRAQDRVIAARPEAAGGVAADRYRRQTAGRACGGDRGSADDAVRLGRARCGGGGVRPVQERGEHAANHAADPPHFPTRGGRGRWRAVEGGQLHTEALRRRDSRAAAAALCPQ